ncbi:MAG TPA: universal stress protein [Casimicrobiaceae bacterium]|nr:universal stress protein [Casimicrobiaceae bacterium]
MFKRILIAVDGSPASNAGLRTAIGLSADQHASLVALHIVDDTVIAINFEGGYLPPNYVDGFYEELRKNGRRTLDKVERVARGSNVGVECVLAEAHGQTVAHVILQQARKLKTDLIVLGTHGRRGLRRALMGSDAEAVVREARVPVLLVRSPERAKPKARTAVATANRPPRARRSAGPQPQLAPA